MYEVVMQSSLGLALLNKLKGRLFVKTTCNRRIQHIEDASSMGRAARIEGAGEWSDTEGRAGNVTQSLRKRRDHMWIPDIETRTCDIELILETQKF